MHSPSVRLLAICGSLRAVSTNLTLLKAAAMLVPPGVVIEGLQGLGDLPHFNPDLDVEPAPPQVAVFREAVAGRRTDHLLAEYARGVPGSLKNALDWLVSSDVFPQKPVALFNASDRSVAMQAALRLTLETMSAKMVDVATITFLCSASKPTPPRSPQTRRGLRRYVVL